MEINWTDIWRNNGRTIEAYAAEKILQNMKVISKLTSQSLGESRPYSLYYEWNSEKMWQHKKIKEWLFFSSGYNILQIIGYLFH